MKTKTAPRLPRSRSVISSLGSKPTIQEPSLTEVISKSLRVSNPSDTIVRFSNGKKHPEKKLNMALRQQDAAGKAEILNTFLKTWFSINSAEAKHSQTALKEIVECYGTNNTGPLCGCRLMFTLSPDGHHFRCWFTIPSPTQKGTEGVLFTISGPPGPTQSLINRINILDLTKVEAFYQMSTPKGTMWWIPSDVPHVLF